MKQKFDTSAIEGYENMSPEDKIKALESFEFDDHSEEIERLKSSVSKANSEAAEWKKKHNSQLSDDERAKAESEARVRELEAKVQEFEARERTSGYKADFLGLGFNPDLAGQTAEALTNGDTKTLFANLKKALTEHDAKFKSELMGDITPPPAGQGTKTEKNYSELIAQAQENHDMALAAAYTRMQAEENAKKTT